MILLMKEIETKTNKPIVNLRLVAISFTKIDIIKPKIKEKSESQSMAFLICF